jgi:hypothetical protein
MSNWETQNIFQFLIQLFDSQIQILFKKQSKPYYVY